MAELAVIDDIVKELGRIRGVDLPPVALKLIILAYLMYCCNTYDVKYENEDGDIMRLNSGCIILCQKGTGKSRALRKLKSIFKGVEVDRNDRFYKAKDTKIGTYLRSMIPLTGEEKKKVEEFYALCGKSPVGVFDDPITSKGLCETYSQSKAYQVNNLLFTVDEAGDRIFRDAFSRDPSISAREFMQAINQLFDGYCGMGKSKTSKAEGIESQYDIGANFIFVSTAEFLKDYHVQQRYQSSFEGGIARRLLYVNCPPIDKYNVDFEYHYPDFKRFEAISNMVFDTEKLRSKKIPVSVELKAILRDKKLRGNVTIDDEFLLLLFCVVLAIWTGKEEVTTDHWEYMINVFADMKGLSMTVVQKDTTSYDKVCVFIREYLEQNSTSKKIPLALVKDFCVRNKMCFDSQFKKWFSGMCKEFVESNTSRYIIERNQMFAWLEENFAFGG